MHLNKKTKGFLAFFVLLIAIRVALPYVILHFANKTLAENIEGYTGHIEDVDLALYRGAYRIIDLKIEAVDNGVKEPFLEVPAIDLSVEWNSIFHGAFTGEVVVEQPKVVFAFAKSGAAAQTGEEVDWVEVVQDFMPITINRFAIQSGDVALQNAWQEPKVDLTVENLNFELFNIRNVEDRTEELPSPFTASANFPGYGGTFEATGGASLLQTIPDFNYDARLENFQLVKANELAKFYSGMDFEKGTLSVYSELALADGKFKGYVKPLLKDVQIFALKEGDRNIGQFFAELFSEGLQELLENHRKEQLATRVPLEGTIDVPETEIWTTFISVLRNAYIDAFRPVIDQTVEYDDAKNGEDGKEKKGFFKRLFSGDKDEQEVSEEPTDSTEEEGLLKKIF